MSVRPSRTGPGRVGRPSVPDGVNPPTPGACVREPACEAQLGVKCLALVFRLSV